MDPALTINLRAGQKMKCTDYKLKEAVKLVKTKLIFFILIGCRSFCIFVKVFVLHKRGRLIFFVIITLQEGEERKGQKLWKMPQFIFPVLLPPRSGVTGCSAPVSQDLDGHITLCAAKMERVVNISIISTSLTRVTTTNLLVESPRQTMETYDQSLVHNKYVEL